MYTVCRTFEVAASHTLTFAASGVSEPVHGHNWKIEVCCKSACLDADGFVVNPELLEQTVMGSLDHCHLNYALDIAPSTENVARWIKSRIPQCVRVDVWEDSCSRAAAD